MAEQLNRRTLDTEKQIENLRERIKKLDHDQNRAMKIAAYLPTSKQATQDDEDRGKRLAELRRELLDLIRSQK
jgi:hypothetical protein